MEFTTPPSYGSTTVNAGAIVTDDKIIYAGTDNTAKHTEVKADPDNGWPEPAAVKLTWSDVAVLEGSYGPRLDRVDIMAEVPKFVKQIVASAAGTKPYIYQVSHHLAYMSTLDHRLTRSSFCPNLRSR